MRPLGWVQESVLRVLRDGPKTPADIIEATGIRRERVNEACRRLVRRRLIRITGQRRHPVARPAHIYELGGTP